jgi:hypothetical protein
MGVMFPSVPRNTTHYGKGDFYIAFYRIWQEKLAYTSLMIQANNTST